jgi:hypothetical protein
LLYKAALRKPTTAAQIAAHAENLTAAIEELLRQPLGD